MTCYCPLPAKNTVCTVSGLVGVRVMARSELDKADFFVGCGSCIGCRLHRSKMWAVRCVHEASLHHMNSFVTLTYNDKSLQVVETEDGNYKVGTLVPRHVKNFMKYLRKRFPCVRIRFFLCGEYGADLGRPHYHLILFGFDFFDKVYWKTTKVGSIIYRSPLLESLWKFGYSSVADVTCESAAYVARYCLKKVNGKKAQAHYDCLEPEFSRMSRRPGIAKKWMEQFPGDVFPHDYVVMDNGIKLRPPRYYDDIYDLTNFDDLIKIKESRMLYAKDDKDSTYERLAVRQQVQEASLPLLERSLENDS